MDERTLPTMVAEQDEYEQVYDAIQTSPTCLTFTDDGRALINQIDQDGELIPIAEFVPVTSTK